jgi:hypothetical protein
MFWIIGVIIAVLMIITLWACLKVASDYDDAMGYDDIK